MGRVIGRSGRVANAIRALAACRFGSSEQGQGRERRRRVVLEIE